MKILMLTPYLPFPLLSGGQIRTYNLLKNLSKDHEITLFALIKKEEERRYIPELSKYCVKVQVFKRPEKPFTLATILRTGLSLYPFLVIRNLVEEVKYAVSRELKRGKYDLIHAETFYMMPNIPRTKTPVLLVEQTIEYLGYLSYTKSTSWWFLKPLLYIDILKIRFWEEFFWKTANRLVVMSQDDKRFIQDSISLEFPVEVVENGVDVAFFKQTKKNLPKRPTVLFVGTFNWLPNIEAVQYLIHEVWPIIKQKLPDAELQIVGNAPTDAIRDSASKYSDITIRGRVEDIRDAYAAAHVLVAPVFSGKGTRYKVLEAFATRTPVVGTSLAFEGLDTKNGQHMLVANDASSLAEQAVRVLSDTKLRESLGKNGEELVFGSYNWTEISKKLSQIYQQVAKPVVSSTKQGEHE